MTHKGLHELKAVKRQLDEQAKAIELEKKQQHEALLKRISEQEVFRTRLAQTMGTIKPLRHEKTTALTPVPIKPIAAQRRKDEQSALQESLSDDWDTSSLLDTDETLSYRRPGIGSDVVRKLRRGEWAVQAELDLHSLRSDEARSTLAQFIRNCHAQGLRCLRVVHGKGLGSLGKEPVLKPKVQSWLIQKNEVLAFVQAMPLHGGAGALMVLLQTRK